MQYSDLLQTQLRHKTPLKTVSPRAPHQELLYYSNAPHFSNQPKNFANKSKAQSSELPQSLHTVSKINKPQDISFISESSISESLSTQFLSPTPSQIASSSFNQTQGPVINIERLLSKASRNHSSNIVNSSPYFQKSLPLSCHGTTPKITLSANTPNSSSGLTFSPLYRTQHDFIPTYL